MSEEYEEVSQELEAIQFQIERSIPVPFAELLSDYRARNFPDELTRLDLLEEIHELMESVFIAEPFTDAVEMAVRMLFEDSTIFEESPHKTMEAVPALEELVATIRSADIVHLFRLVTMVIIPLQIVKTEVTNPLRLLDGMNEDALLGLDAEQQTTISNVLMHKVSLFCKGYVDGLQGDALSILDELITAKAEKDFDINEFIDYLVATR